MRTDYTTTDLENMRNVLQTRAWRLLEEHFADVREGTVESVLDPNLEPDKLAHLRGEEAGRREVLSWFRERLEDAHMTIRTEEDA